MPDPNPESERLWRVDMPRELSSRGSGELVPMGEACVFDFMPQIIGARFMTDESLSQRIHHFDIGLPFVRAADVYQKVAWEELEAGQLNGALDAYRQALHNSASFIKLVSLGQQAIALSEDELQRLDLEPKLGELESRLAQEIWAGEFSFNPDDYKEFVKQTRTREKRWLQLNQLLYSGYSEAFGEVLVAEVRNPSLGREYIDLCVAMNRFDDAQLAAEELGWNEEAQTYSERSADMPQIDPRIQAAVIIYNADRP